MIPTHKTAQARSSNRALQGCSRAAQRDLRRDFPGGGLGSLELAAGGVSGDVQAGGAVMPWPLKMREGRRYSGFISPVRVGARISASAWTS